MPLKTGSSQEIISKNIETEINAGKKPEVAKAIAYSKARETGKGPAAPAKDSNTWKCRVV